MNASRNPIQIRRYLISLNKSSAASLLPLNSLPESGRSAGQVLLRRGKHLSGSGSACPSVLELRGKVRSRVLNAQGSDNKEAANA